MISLSLQDVSQIEVSKTNGLKQSPNLRFYTRHFIFYLTSGDKIRLTAFANKTSNLKIIKSN